MKKKHMTILAFMEHYIAYLRSIERLGTAQNYYRTQRSLSCYLEGKDIAFSALTDAMIVNYEHWLKERDVTRNTVSFYMRILRTVCRKAGRENIYVNDQAFSNVYTGVDRTKKRAVDQEVVYRLKKLDLKGNRPLTYARDLFLFSFYTRGMSFVDMAFLKKNHIADGCICYVRHKTNQLISIRLEPCMAEIIDRYSDERQPYLFPIVKTKNGAGEYRQYQNALCYYNKQLKRLSALLHLPYSLSSYTARHTWATLARNYNIPLPVISAGMGHSSPHITQIYLATLDTSVVDEANARILSKILRE